MMSLCISENAQQFKPSPALVGDSNDNSEDQNWCQKPKKGITLLFSFSKIK